MLVIIGVSSSVSRSFQSILYTLTSFLRSIFMNLYPLYKGLLMKVVGIALIVYHADLAMAFHMNM